MRFSSGSRLGPYEIVAPLGEGGMGEVYRAVDKRLARPVAIKILSGRMTENRRALSRFEREARAIAALTHPNILSIFEFEVEGETPFVVTELLEGVTLRQRMAARIPWRTAAELGAAIADGLAAAHARGVTHRDLKPENVFITYDGRVKILDFGIAHVKEDDEVQRAPSDTEPTAEYRADAPLGTVGYVSPEQIRMKEPEPTSDIFSLGVILYEMIAGANPFVRGTATETLAAILSDEPEPLKEVAPEVPARYARLVAHCIEKDAHTRFQSARDLAFELREIAGGGRKRFRLREHRLSAGAAALVALFGLTATLVLSETRAIRFLGNGDPPLTSVAILPLANATGDPSLEYLSDGLTEALIDRLSAIGELRVTARPVVFEYKNSSLDPIAIGTKLGVSAIVTGRVISAGDSVDVHLDVVDTAERSQLWGRTFRRPREEIPSVPGDIARAIAKELRLRLTRAESEHVARAATGNAPAYEQYMRGKDALSSQKLDSRQTAIRYFKQAIELDPRFALAHAALGQTYLFYSVNTDPELMKANARGPIARALELDPDLPEAHLALALLRYFDWDLEGAEAEFRRTIELNDDFALAHAYYGYLHLYRGRFERAIEEARRARAIDPTSANASNILIVSLLQAGRLDEALREAQKLVRVAPDGFTSHYMLGRVLAARGDDAAACDEFVKSRKFTRVEQEDVRRLEAACASGGLEAYRRALIAILQTGEISVEAFEIASLYAQLGELENAYHYLEVAYEEHSNGLLAIGIEPAFAALREDPRVLELLRRGGLLGMIGMRSAPAEAGALRGGEAVATGPARR